MKNIAGILCILLCGFTLHLQANVLSSERRNKKPDWVENHPVNPDYYFGIGMAQKSNKNYLQIAKNNALQDLTSEISVQITGTSSLKQMATNDEMVSEYESNTRLKIREELENHELVDTWEDDEEYWVYYRLSKSTYQMAKQEKITRAKNKSLQHYNDARKAENSLNIGNAIRFYLEAFKAVYDYLNEDLTVLLEDGKKDLPNEIYSSYFRLLDNIELKARPDELHVTILKPVSDEIEVSALYKGKGNITNLPLEAAFEKGDGNITKSAITGNNGKARFNINQVTSKTSNQSILFSFDLPSYFEDEDNEMVTSLFYKENSIASTRILLDVEGLTAKLNAEETIFGHPSDERSFENEIRRFLTSNYFSMSEDNPDVMIELTIDTKKGDYKPQFKIFSTITAVNISFINAKNNEVILTEGFNNLRSTSTQSFEDAADKAARMVVQKLIANVTPKLKKYNF